MPNVVLEAQLSGLPVVISHQANCDGLVTHGQDGFEVRTGAPGALADAMAQLMRMPQAAREQMGQCGRLRVTNRFSTPAISKRLSALYDEAMETDACERMAAVSA
jgi:glycosyltransferase involved in cell wall biosynthesis